MYIIGLCYLNDFTDVGGTYNLKREIKHTFNSVISEGVVTLCGISCQAVVQTFKNGGSRIIDFYDNESDIKGSADKLLNKYKNLQESIEPVSSRMLRRQGLAILVICIQLLMVALIVVNIINKQYTLSIPFFLIISVICYYAYYRSHSI